MTPIPQITAAEAAHYSLSIRTTSGGLAFCITSEGVEGAATPRCIHSGRLEASASAHSVYEVLQELYFTYEFLSYPYRSIKFFYEPEQAVLDPRLFYKREGMSFGSPTPRTLQAHDKERP